MEGADGGGLTGEYTASTAITELALEVDPGLTVKEFSDLVLYSGRRRTSFHLTGDGRFVKALIHSRAAYNA